ncbi:hypothetical protein BKN38_06390 [Helicobacter sp. CLO-3]|uniref:HP0495 family protein n=1 Tax=unclassified Helicobacter TaxID=2593540 RepID=UPI0008053653|nr:MULTISPECIES: DUF493 domain-containing protein [unclassified Helicobacter]OBV29716.1 hypothetical protein BA723_04265 [Helicobacter sp. CLO-3]OHU82830.1 hypothetical protein BKN38_06390 [Helicobacter sp. CLO-3]
MQHIEGKPDITYPCQWEYRIVGEKQHRIEEIVGDIMQKPYYLEVKNHSSGGRFVSMHLSTMVDSEEERNEIFSKLANHKEIKMVI